MSRERKPDRTDPISEVARGSLAELDRQIRIARDLDYLTDPDASQEPNHLHFARLNALITTKRQPDIRGSQ